MNLEIKHYEKNLQGKDYVVGDIHGHFRQLMQILIKIKFNFKKDRLFSVGDLCDRGPDSKEVLNWLTYNWFIPVIGNHEALIIGYVENLINFDVLLKVGAQWWFDVKEDSQKIIVDYFTTLPIAIEVETINGKIGIVHAACPTKSWNDFKSGLHGEDYYTYANKAIWTYAEKENKYNVEDIDYIVVGHTTQHEYLKWENVFLIDTGATFENGYFTILDLETLKPVNYKNINLV